MAAVLAGFLAGIVNGIFGGAGGMVLIPALSRWTDSQSDTLFPLSVRVMLCISAVTLGLSALNAALPWRDAMPYLIGGAAGGAAAGRWGTRIPAVWLHRIFGVMLLWGGVRYLCLQ